MGVGWEGQGYMCPLTFEMGEGLASVLFYCIEPKVPVVHQPGSQVTTSPLSTDKGTEFTGFFPLM